MKTALPILSSGAAFCTLPDGSRQCTGSRMGRADSLPEDFDRLTASPKLRLIRLPWVGGDYDPAGAYWGNSGGSHIYRAVACLPCAPAYWFGHVELFVRAKDRSGAKAAILAKIPNAKFYV